VSDRWIPDLRGTKKTLFSIGSALLSAAGLTAARTLTLPDRAGTIALKGDWNNPFLLDNATIVTSRSGNAETHSLKTAAGADPSAADPVRVAFRNAAGDGFDIIEQTAALSVTISSGSTLSLPASTPTNVWDVLFNDSGTLRLGVVVCRLSDGVYPLQDNVLESSTAEGGAGAADSAGVIYTGTAVTSKPMRVLWRHEYSLTTPGTWNTAPTNSQPYGAGVRLPGEVVGQNRVRDGSFSSGTTTLPSDNTIPQSTEGVAFSSNCSYTPRSAANFLEISALIQIENSTGNNMGLALFRDSEANAVASSQFNNNQSGARNHQFISHTLIAGTASSQTFKIRGGGSAAGTTTFNSFANAAAMGGTMASYIAVAEIQT